MPVWIATSPYQLSRNFNIDITRLHEKYIYILLLHQKSFVHYVQCNENVKLIPIGLFLLSNNFVHDF